MHFPKSTFDPHRLDEAIRAEKVPLNSEKMKRSKAGKEGRKVWMNRVDIMRIRVKNK